MRRLALVTIAAVLAIPALAQTPKTVTVAGTKSALGTAMLTPAPTGVMVQVDLKGLTPGWHALHFHAKGDCSDAAAGVKASGSHVHEGTEAPVHGLLNPSANDSGDLPNIYVGKDGMVKAEVFSTLVSMDGANGKPSLMDADGSALLVHAKADDYKSQPIGGAGDRVGCAVIR